LSKEEESGTIAARYKNKGDENKGFFDTVKEKGIPMLKSFKESIIEKAQALKRLRNASVEPHASDSRSLRMSIADANMNTEHLEPPRPGEVGALPSDINAEMQTPGTISQDPAIRAI